MDYRLEIPLLVHATLTSNITITDYSLEVLDTFIYLGSAISNKLSLDKALDRRIGREIIFLAWLRTRMCKNLRISTPKYQCITAVFLVDLLK